MSVTLADGTPVVTGGGVTPDDGAAGRATATSSARQMSASPPSVSPPPPSLPRTHSLPAGHQAASTSTSVPSGRAGGVTEATHRRGSSSTASDAFVAASEDYSVPPLSSASSSGSGSGSGSAGGGGKSASASFKSFSAVLEKVAAKRESELAARKERLQASIAANAGDAAQQQQSSSSSSAAAASPTASIPAPAKQSQPASRYVKVEVPPPIPPYVPKPGFASAGPPSASASASSQQSRAPPPAARVDDSGHDDDSTSDGEYGLPRHSDTSFTDRARAAMRHGAAGVAGRAVDLNDSVDTSASNVSFVDMVDDDILHDGEDEEDEDGGGVGFDEADGELLMEVAELYRRHRRQVEGRSDSDDGASGEEFDHHEGDTDSDESAHAHAQQQQQQQQAAARHHHASSSFEL